MFLILELFFLFHYGDAIRTNMKTLQEEITYDISVLPLPYMVENGLLTSTSLLPDWSDVKRKTPQYIEVLLAVDAAVARYYGHELERIRAAMLTLMHAVNMYAFQLDIRITVVDVVPVHGHNITLEEFLEWRHTTETLVTHDLAILVRYRYEGGIAYVNGVCKRTAVGITGFFPEAPYEYASVFFHELSHLLGLSHSATADCHCPKKKHSSCLRIDGFDHECSAQALVDLLPTIECLVEPPQLPRSVLALCGNGIVEEDEDCDCGPLRYCINALCEPRTCRFVMAKQYLYTTVTFGTALSIFGILILIKQAISRKTGSQRSFANKISSPLSHKPMLCDVNFSPVERNPHTGQLKNTLATSLMSSPTFAVQIPNVVNSQFHSVRKPRAPLTLDSEIPVSVELMIPSDYVPMNPPKGMIWIQFECARRLSSINPNSRETSGALSLMASKRMDKPSQLFLSSLDDSLKVHTS